MGDAEIDNAAKLLEVKHFAAGQVIIHQGEEGEDCFIVDSGEAYASIRIGAKAGDSIPAVGGEWKEVVQYTAGGFFGERALLHAEPRAATITARTNVTAFRMAKTDFETMIRERDHKENLIRGVTMFETFNDDQVAALGSVLERQTYAKGESIMKQGEMGYHFYILDEGECAATIKQGDGVEQEVKRYHKGELFGEKALLEAAPRGATISACGAVAVFALSKAAFEKKLGPLSQLKAEAYIADPRKLIADFYGPGDSRGTAGVLEANGWTPKAGDKSDWFVVYRPCSRDSIAKMLGKIGVGKGLNIKGKSAKKNRLSGFVPFLQISDNEDKEKIEAAPVDARTKIYYRKKDAREEALRGLNKAWEANKDNPTIAKIKVPKIEMLDDYAPDVYGLDLPEPLMKQAYIMQPDITHPVGWETGRASEPAFMDMNLHAVRGTSVPNVVLYQYDLADAMNPHGLVVAYEEKLVKPVVSDFDTFTVGSKGSFEYEPTPDEQVELIQWCLKHTKEVMETPKNVPWTSRWLQVLKKEAERGFHPTLPKYGFGDPSSYALVDQVVKVTEACGAVRHGAECFNFYFPQELDDEFLIVWEGLEGDGKDPPWKLVGEPELREFLLERAKEGFTFPLNPVWPIRDKGWYKVLEALRDSEDEVQLASIDSWFPPESEVLDTIDEIHHENPGGFKNAQLQKRCTGVNDFTALAGDCGGTEMADFALEHVRRQVQARWRRIRFAFRMTILKFADQEKALDETDPERHDRGDALLSNVE